MWIIINLADRHLKSSLPHNYTGPTVLYVWLCMGNGCSNSSATAVGAPAAEPGGEAKPKKKRSVVGNVVHNVKKKMKPKKPQWNDSQPEEATIRKNHSELDDQVESKKQVVPKKVKPKKQKEPKTLYLRRPHGPKAWPVSDGSVDTDFHPEASIDAGGGDAPF